MHVMHWDLRGSLGKHIYSWGDGCFCKRTAVLQVRFITKFITPSYRDFIGKKDDEPLSPQNRTHSLNSQNNSSEWEDGKKSTVTQWGQKSRNDFLSFISAYRLILIRAKTFQESICANGGSIQILKVDIVGSPEWCRLPGPEVGSVQRLI